MAFPTAVNDQITDAVTQNSVNILGSSPAIAMGTVIQAIAHAAGIGAQNATAHQQMLNMIQAAMAARINGTET